MKYIIGYVFERWFLKERERERERERESESENESYQQNSHC